MDTHRGKFRYFYFLLAAVAVGGMLAFFARVATVDTRTVTKTVEKPQPLNTVVQVGAALGPADQSAPGGQVNPALDGSTCQLWTRPDGVVIACG